jgi:hypothetical protein
LTLTQGSLVFINNSEVSYYGIQQGPLTDTRQVIVTTTLRIDSERSISARLVGQNGTGNIANIAGQPGTNIYMAYSQRTRSGTDYFLIVGDPNMPNTRGQVTFKMAKAL